MEDVLIKSFLGKVSILFTLCFSLCSLVFSFEPSVSGSNLTCEQKEKIEEAISYFVEMSIEEIIEDMSSIEEFKAHLMDLEPLEIFLYVIQSPSFRQSFEAISADEAKYGFLIMMFDISMSKAKASGQIYSYLKVFVDSFSIDEVKIMQFIDQEEYMDLMHYLFDLDLSTVTRN